MADLSWLTARPIAHRGLHDMNQTRWENTLSAFQAAIDRNYSIECDVHLSADGVPIVFHDRDLQRLTGVEGAIFERTAAQMAASRIGGTGDHAPSLTEVLDLVAGRVPLIIELKGIAGKDEGLVAAVAALLRSYDGLAAIMSFDHWLIRQFGVQAAGIPTGLTAQGNKPDELEAHFSMLSHPISFVSWGVHHLPSPFVSFARKKLSMPVITWTVRDEQAIEATHAHADQMTFEGFDPDTGVGLATAGRTRI